MPDNDDNAHHDVPMRDRADRNRGIDRQGDRPRDRDNRGRRRSRSPDAMRRQHQPVTRSYPRNYGSDATRETYRDGRRNEESRSQRGRAPDAAGDAGVPGDDMNTSRSTSPRQWRLDYKREDVEDIRRGRALPSQTQSFASTLDRTDEPAKPKEKPNFYNTGLLAAAANTITQIDGSTVTLKYHEPPEARKPSSKDSWRLFVFKDKDVLDSIDLGTRSCWLVGREAAISDLEAAHPSISKQHAVIQFRYIERRNEYGERRSKVKPYIIDLESANGTMLNGKTISQSRYIELRDKDMIQFGHSEREYVLVRARD